VGTVVIASAWLLAGCAGQSKAPDVGGHGGHRTAVVSAGTSVTAMRTFVPFRSDGAPAAGVAAHRSGTCFTTSITVATRDAYRCIAGNTLLDPCFARSQDARNLYCYAGPWSDATRLHLTKSLASTVGAAAPIRFTHPWAIRLSGGIQCVASGGTTDVVRGIALSYQCDTGQAGLYPSQDALQTALFSGRNGALHKVDVAIEWRG
jgi:hypothetical protein